MVPSWIRGRMLFIVGVGEADSDCGITFGGRDCPAKN